MYRSNFATELRRAIGAGVVTGAALLAACSDSTTAPEATVPSGANAITIGGGQYPDPMVTFVSVRMIDTTGATITEIGRVHILTPNSPDSIDVLDNTPKDLDSRPGFITAKIPKAASYKACFAGSLSYAGDFWGAYTYLPCSTEVATNAQSVQLGVVYGKRKPRVVMLAKNEFGALVGGATYSFKTSDWQTAHTTYEGSGFDRSAVEGNFTYDYFRKPHSDMKVCEVSPPPKHALTSTKCFTVALKFGGIHTLVFHHERLLY